MGERTTILRNGEKPAGNEPGSGARPAQPQTPERPASSMAQELSELRDTLAALYAREALLDAVIQSLPIWITVKDMNGRYLLVNNAIAESNGLTPADYVGKSSKEVQGITKEEREVLDTLAQMVISSGNAIERPSYLAKLPDGTEQVRRMIKLPLHDSDGHMLGVIGWSEDITQRVEVEASLDRNRRLLHSLFEVMPHALSYTDRDRKLRMVNRKWCETVGVRPEQVLDRTILEVEQLPQSVRQALWNEGSEIFETGIAPPISEHVLPRSDGAPRILQVSKAPVVAHGAVDGFVTLSIDITELRTAEQSSQAAHQRLKDALESIPAAIYLYDNQDRLFLANTMAKSLYPGAAHLMRPGTTFAELATGVAREVYPDEVERAQFVERRLKEFRHIVRQVEHRGPNGQFLLGQDRRTTEGGTVSIRFDITEQKRIQKELEQRERQTRTELKLAAEMQQHILRDVKPAPFIRESHEFRPSSFVSGDVFHSSCAPDGSFLFFLGDATGHGVSAALITMVVEATLSAMPPEMPLHEMAEQLNARLVAYRLDGMYVSGVFIRITPGGEMRYCNAGHPSAVVHGDLTRAMLESSGPPMGWFDGPGYESGTVQLAPRDKVVLLTDGLVEWANADGEEFGASAVEQTVRDHANKDPRAVLDALITAASSHALGQECKDDLSVFVFEYQPPPSTSAAAPARSG